MDASKALQKVSTAFCSDATQHNQALQASHGQCRGQRHGTRPNPAACRARSSSFLEDTRVGASARFKWDGTHHMDSRVPSHRTAHEHNICQHKHFPPCLAARSQISPTSSFQSRFLPTRGRTKKCMNGKCQFARGSTDKYLEAPLNSVPRAVFESTKRMACRTTTAASKAMVSRAQRIDSKHGLRAGEVIKDAMDGAKGCHQLPGSYLNTTSKEISPRVRNAMGSTGAWVFRLITQEASCGVTPVEAYNLRHGVWATNAKAPLPVASLYMMERGVKRFSNLTTLVGTARKYDSHHWSALRRRRDSLQPPCTTCQNKGAMYTLAPCMGSKDLAQAWWNTPVQPASSKYCGRAPR